MPQLSSNRCAEADQSSLGEALKKLSHSLEQEICAALLGENNPLAERLTSIRAELNRLR